MDDQTPQTFTEFLLDILRDRPGMFLKEPKISMLSTFLLGYSVGRTIARQEDDFYGEHGFIPWLLHKKGNPRVSFWEVILMEEANNDEYRALELFFEYLEEFQQEKNQPNE